MTDSHVTGKWASWGPRLLSILRIVVAFMFMQSGAMKLFAFPTGMPPDNSTAVMWTQVWFGGMLEFFGGALALIGLFTRPVTFILSGMMAVAYWQFHAPGGFWVTINGGTAAALYCFVWLYFSAVGGGPWSVDALRRKRMTFST